MLAHNFLEKSTNGAALNDYQCGAGNAQTAWANTAQVRTALHVPEDSNFFSGDNGNTRENVCVDLHTLSHVFTSLFVNSVKNFLVVLPLISLLNDLDFSSSSLSCVIFARRCRDDLRVDRNQFDALLRGCRSEPS